MMNKADECLLSYIYAEYPDAKEREVFLNENRFPFNFYDKGAATEKAISQNRVSVAVTIKEMIRIEKRFVSQNIKALYFKGLILGKQLYTMLYLRSVGDIDIYVDKLDMDKAVNILISLGYHLCDSQGMKNPHHVIFTNVFFRVELHKRICHPKIEIDDTYFLKHTRHIPLQGVNFTTFDVTGTLLHLLYHLYMDSILTMENYTFLYNAFLSCSFPKAERFYFRAYEIALFSEHYANEILWEEVFGNIVKQDLRIMFKKMILDIANIFPMILPLDIMRQLLQVPYRITSEDRVLGCIDKYGNEGIERALCQYIDTEWNDHMDINSHIVLGEGFDVLLKENINDDKPLLTCNIHTALCSEGISLQFCVEDDNIVISESKDFDTLTSSGVHVILCSTTLYSYNSIFFFPKYAEDNSIQVVTINARPDHETIIPEALIQASFCQSQGGYHIDVVLTNRFVEENHIDSFFYLGAVVSYCNIRSRRREKQIVLSGEESNWFNPAYFLKVDCRDCS